MEKMNGKLVTFTGIIVLVLLVAIFGFLFWEPKPEYIQGEAEATEVRISGKVPGRIEIFRFNEGEQVSRGDTVAILDSPEVLAKYSQAEAAEAAAQALNEKAERGTRSEQIVMTEDEGIVAILRGISDRSDLNEAMRESTVPQLLIFGRHDEYVTPETAEATIAAHPQAEVLWLENSGHMGFIEEPEKTAEAVTCFVGRIFGETQPEKNGAANKAPHDNDKTD